MIGLSALVGFGRVDVAKAREQESRMQKARLELAGEEETPEAAPAEPAKAP
ncbi:MAG: hypothetical protein U0836_26025 [Pirellulales bacterium]